MMRSMTGYGKGSAEGTGLRITVELRSLNNRFADLKLRLPAGLAVRESEIRRKILSRVRRGRVEMALSTEPCQGSEPVLALNRPLLTALTSAARAIREEFHVAGELDLKTVLSLPEVFLRAAEPADPGEAHHAVDLAIDAALVALDAEREREGKVLRDELLERISRMQALVGEIRGRAAEMPSQVQRKLLERLASLLGSVPVDPGRIAQEAAFLADRSDVTEELVRLEGHLNQARSLLSEPDGEPVGKRLDFLLQEINRETNTVNSKAPDLEVSRLALALKSEAEKVREQVQNVE